MGGNKIVASSGTTSTIRLIVLLACAPRLISALLTSLGSSQTCFTRQPQGRKKLIEEEDQLNSDCKAENC